MVKSGYKQTEIGVIPEDWEVNSIQSVVVSYRTGGNYKNSIEVSSFPLIKMGNLSRGYINLNKLEYIAKGLEPSPADKLQYGDVIFNTRNTPELVGKTAVWRNELRSAYYNSNLLRFEFEVDRIDPFFFNFILNTKEVLAELKNIAKGTTSVAAIYPQDLMKVRIQIPPLDEQKRIAKAIIELDDLLSILEKQISKKKAIKQGAMQELLTGKKRLPGFSGEWEFMELGKYGTLLKESINPQLFSSECFWEYSMPAFDSGKTPVKKNGTDMHSNRTVISGKLLLFNKLNVRQKRIWMINQCRDRAVCSSEFLPYQSDKINLELLAQILNTDQVTLEFIGMSTGTSNSQKRITPGNFLEYKVYLPVDENEQAAIAEVFVCMDNEVKALEEKLAKYRQVKQGMMQQLLTGKIRLV